MQRAIIRTIKEIRWSSYLEFSKSATTNGSLIKIWPKFTGEISLRIEDKLLFFKI